MTPICRARAVFVSPTFFLRAMIFRAENVFSAETGPAETAREPFPATKSSTSFRVGTDRRVLAPRPSGNGRFIDAEFLRQFLLGESQGTAKPLQFSDQVVCFWQGIVPKESDNSRKAIHTIR